MGEDRSAQVVLEYVHAVRNRWTVPVAPPGFVPDWADRPSPHTYYPAAERLALPLHEGRLPSEEGRFDLPLLASFLELTAGVLSRRWQIDRGQDSGARWGRGTPSGGGAYPLELYWAAGPPAPVPAGVYHYGSGLHALERVAVGDPLPELGASGGESQYLLCALRFWKSTYKYTNFAYHLMLHDLGSFLGSWEALCQEHGIESRPQLSFDDLAVSRLIGAEPDRSAVLAVLPLPWAKQAPEGVAERPAPDRPVRPVATAPYERSRRTRVFPLIGAVHRATSAPARTVGDAREEVPEPLPEGAVRLPSTASGQPFAQGPDTADCLARRRSANGCFHGTRPLSPDELGEVLNGSKPLRLAVHRVTGLTPGVYDYLPEHHAVVPVDGTATEALDERIYALPNYSVSQAAATLVLHWQPEQAVAAGGARAYRSAAIEAGANAQRIQLAATRRRLAVGIVLGFDGPALESALGLAKEERHGLLCLFLGHPQEGTAALDDRLY
ncbi:nitroreductase family protein [Streptomyces sp. NPDC055886]